MLNIKKHPIYLMLIKELPFTDDLASICAALREAIADVEAAIADIEDNSEIKMVYYGQ